MKHKKIEVTQRFLRQYHDNGLMGRSLKVQQEVLRAGFILAFKHDKKLRNVERGAYQLRVTPMVQRFMNVEKFVKDLKEKKMPPRIALAARWLYRKYTRRVKMVHVLVTCGKKARS